MIGDLWETYLNVNESEIKGVDDHSYTLASLSLCNNRGSIR